MHILFHRFTPWQGSIHSSTGIFAEQFIRRGYDVTYMSSVIHPGRLAKKKLTQKIQFRSGAFTFSPFTLVPFTKNGIFSSGYFSDLSYQSFFPSLVSIMDQGHGSPDLIWTVPPGSSALRKNFPDAKLIMQVVDYYPAFLGERIKAIEQRDYRRADHVFTIGEAMSAYLTEELGIDPAKITSLGQGVHLEQYQKDYIEPEELKDLPHPRSVWVGVVNKGDEKMFREVARTMERRGGTFLLIGPKSAWADEFENEHRAVKCLGPRSPQTVPAYLKHSDIGVMLYDQEKSAVYKGQHPLKLYEYAAAGLPILSTPHEEYRYLDPPCMIVRQKEEIEPLIEKILEDQTHYKTFSIRFAEKHTWSKACQLAITTINKLFDK